MTYKFSGNGIQYWPNKGVDANGVPIYDFANPVRFDVPFTDYTPPANDPNGYTDLGQVNRIKYLSGTDTMPPKTKKEVLVLGAGPAGLSK